MIIYTMREITSRHSELPITFISEYRLPNSEGIGTYALAIIDNGRNHL